LLGNYQTALNEGTKISSSDETIKLQRDIYLYRCYIEQGNYQIVLDEIKNTFPTDLKAIRLLALYNVEPEKAAQLLPQCLKEEALANNPTFQYVAALMHYSMGNFDQALRCIIPLNSLDGTALLVQIYLSMQRMDLAEQELQNMQKISDDAIQTQLAQAWILVAQGGDKYQEAQYIYQELIDKYGQSISLLNGLAVCYMNMKKFPDAEKALLDALEKNPKSAETIINLIVCYQHMKKPPESLRRYLNMLRQVAPSHPWVGALGKVDQSFESNSVRFSIP